uniref:Gamma-glutamyltransferase 5 n=1 Tax=Denticeps clupeoides TaxID=299321 RepID=A0AAY4AV01_9TELE
MQTIQARQAHTRLGLQRAGVPGNVWERAFLSLPLVTVLHRCTVIVRLNHRLGLNVLKEGGSAVDAAIAALLCTSLVNPQSMGIGGGSIFTIMDKNGKVKIISSRETAPKAFKADLLKECSARLMTGTQWIGVPGELRGYQEAHRLYGKLPWSRLFEPSIRLAREGIPLPPYLAKFLQMPILKEQLEKSTLCELFCKVNNTLKYPRLAATLDTIAQQGAEAFYTGTIARDLTEDIQAAGGSITLEDLASFKVREAEALTVPLGDYTMFIPPPPAGGVILSFILNIMKGGCFSLTPASIQGDQEVLTMHRYIEACKFANGQKKKIKDTQFNSGDVSYLMQEGFIKRIRAMITSDTTHEAGYYNVTPSLDRFGTTHVSVLAEDGSAVSVTSTINQIFGSMVYSPRTGIILNNELADFCGTSESIRTGEQPPSSMTPSILRSESKGRTIIIGGSGGSLITTAVAMSIMNHVWFGMNLDEAISAPVLFVDGTNKVNFEKQFNKTVKDTLMTFGHEAGNWPYFLNVVNAVSKKNSCIQATSDSRKLGRAAGY